LAELAHNDCLLEIAPERVYPARFFTKTAVGFYPTISPLPFNAVKRRYIFCGTFHRFWRPVFSRSLSSMVSGLSSHLGKPKQRDHPTRTPL